MMVMKDPINGWPSPSHIDMRIRFVDMRNLISRNQPEASSLNVRKVAWYTLHWLQSDRCQLHQISGSLVPAFIQELSFLVGEWITTNDWQSCGRYYANTRARRLSAIARPPGGRFYDRHRWERAWDVCLAQWFPTFFKHFLPWASEIFEFFPYTCNSRIHEWRRQMFYLSMKNVSLISFYSDAGTIYRIISANLERYVWPLDIEFVWFLPQFLPKEFSSSKAPKISPAVVHVDPGWKPL